MRAAPASTALSRRVLLFWAGLLIFAAIGFAGFFLGGAVTSSGPLQVVAALLMAALSAGPAIWLIRRGNIALGSGVLAGYAIASVASFGQCTFLAPAMNYNFLGGALFYLFALAGVLAIAVIAWVIELMTKRN